MGCTYEFRSVDCGLDRPKLLGLFIDGVDAEYYTDPMQALPSALREAQGNALEATEICNERAERVLTRLVRSLQAGSMIPGGIPYAPGVGLDTRRVPAKKRRTEKDAVEAFLNRGGLKGLPDFMEAITMATKVTNAALITEAERRMEALHGAS